MDDDVLSRWWPLAERTDLRDSLVTAYGAAGRGYHDLLHLREVLERAEELVAHEPAADWEVIALAAWYHDAVYDRDPSDEERSAQRADHELGAVLPPERVDEVARLVRMTGEHRPADGDVDGGILSDADLGILAADAERYDRYVAGVRQEYAHVARADFDRGRAAILRALLDKPTLFHTAHARQHWEASARANVEREISQLAP